MDFNLENAGSAFNGFKRILESGVVFSAKTALLLKDFVLDKNNSSLPVRLREAFEELGATYIKLGQFIASAPSLFPKEYVEEMQKCLDSVRPLPFSVVKKAIEKELGGKLSDHFQSFEEKPIASASIAQVHGAITKNGLDVVVKVQRPDINDVLSTDMNLVYLASVIMSSLVPEISGSGLLDIIKDFQTSIIEETDFIKEANNIEEFDRYLLLSKESKARVPRVYRDFSTKRILTMERLYGVALTDLESMKAYTNNPRETLTDALRVWFASLGLTGMFHADVHAGNLMLLKNGQVGFIDFGIVGRISKEVWRGLIDFMDGLAMTDTKLLAKGLVRMDSTAKGIDEVRLAKDLERVFVELNEIAMTIQVGDIEAIDDRRMNRLMFDITDISKRNGLKIPREFGLLIKQLLYFDRYVKILAPDMDLMRDQKLYIPKN